MNIESIHYSFPQLADDLKYIHAINTVNIKSDQIQNISLRSYFRNFKTAFNHMKDVLNEKEVEQLAICGLAALNKNNNEILKKSVRQFVIWLALEKLKCLVHKGCKHRLTGCSCIKN